jgi:hypothetical protein
LQNYRYNLFSAKLFYDILFDKHKKNEQFIERKKIKINKSYFFKKNIIFSDVSFYYNPENIIFDNINLKINAWQIHDVFMMDAITYFMAAVLIYFIPYTQTKTIGDINESIGKRLKNGFNYLKQNQSILIFGICSYMVFAMLLVQIHAVLPIYIKQHLNAKGNVFALADTIYAVGALSAGFFINKLFQNKSIIQVIIALTVVVASIFFAASVSKSILVIYLVSLILGFCNAGIRVLRLTYMFKHIPNTLMGRVGSIFNLINVFTRSVFIFIFSQSFFSFQNNIVYAYAAMAFFLLLSAAMLLVIKGKLAKN